MKRGELCVTGLMLSIAFGLHLTGLSSASARCGASAMWIGTREFNWLVDMAKQKSHNYSFTEYLAISDMIARSQLCRRPLWC